MNDDEVLFKANSISAGYDAKLVIQDITFTLKSHTLTGLIGANGCGKSTLLKSIINQIKHEGICYLNGKGLESQSTRKRAKQISYIPQKSGISISLPVLEVVLMGFNPVLKLLETPSEKQKELARKALEEVGLKGYEEKDYLTLSEGQKQLALLARVLIEDTSLLVLDEPDSALDFQNRYYILKQLKNIVHTGNKAGILSLHDPTLALEFCDQLLLIKDKKCVGVLYPLKDTIEKMEKELKMIYGNVSLVFCEDKGGRRHLVLLWEG